MILSTENGVFRSRTKLDASCGTWLNPSAGKAKKEENKKQSLGSLPASELNSEQAYLGEKLEEEKPALSSIAFSWTFTGFASPRSPSCAVQPLPQMLQELHVPFLPD